MWANTYAAPINPVTAMIKFFPIKDCRLTDSGFSGLLPIDSMTILRTFSIPSRLTAGRDRLLKSAGGGVMPTCVGVRRDLECLSHNSCLPIGRLPIGM